MGGGVCSRIFATESDSSRQESGHGEVVGMQQATFGFVRWGGRRRGAGRKRRAVRARVSHKTRARVRASEPLHVTVRVRDGLPSLRTRAARWAFEGAMARAHERGRIRIVEYSLQANHVHLVVEAGGRYDASNGMQGLLISFAKRLNKTWDRSGGVFADRFHDVVLRTPNQVRNALRYVLNNHLRHDRRRRSVDPFSSAAWFGGWRRPLTERERRGAGRNIVQNARTWLLSVGWRYRGLLDVGEVPVASDSG